jgi:hypothetical protein
MDTTSVARETIAQKALRLYPERTVEPLGHGRYSVEGSEVDYVVDLGIDGGEESCPCPATKPCYHIAIATIYRAQARMAARRVQAAKTAARATRGNLAPLAAAL